MTNEKERDIRVWVRQLAMPILASLIIGGVTLMGTAYMQSKMTKQALESQDKLTAQRFDFIAHEIQGLNSELSEIKAKVDYAAEDRFRRTEHEVYAQEVKARLDGLDGRLRDVEQKVYQLINQN